MKRLNLFLALPLTLFLCMFAGAAFAAEGDSPTQKKRPRSLFAPPVNVNTAGGGSLPKGMALTMINASFAEKNQTKKGYSGSGVFSQSWLLKIRYGITNHFEIAFTTPYVNNYRYSQKSGPDHIEGFADQVVQITLAPFNQHQGDPFSWGLTFGLLLPTGTGGKNHLPGVGAWGGRFATGVGAFVTPDIKLDTEVVWNGPFERGNQNTKRGDQFQWNTNMRYLFDFFDIGLESSLVHQENGDRNFPTGNRTLRNGYTEWFVGPSMNFAIAPVDMWVGVGVFFPVMQDYKGPAAVEDARFEIKIGKMW